MIGVASELSIFISACLFGNQICLGYCVLRVFRRIVKHTLLWVSMEDLVFWTGAALYLFTRMYQTCAGNIRWYFVIGILIGGFITGEFLQRIIVGIDKKVVDKTKKTR